MNRFTLFGCWLFLATSTLLRAADPLPPDTRVLKDLPYVSNPHPNQHLDLYLPPKPLGPLLITIHGGGWVSGTKSEPVALALLQHGFAIASVEYRFSQHAPFPAQIQDCKAAVRWLRAHASEYGYHPNQIGAWGASAGGHLVALLATTSQTKQFDVGENLDQSSAIQCGIDLFGPTDFPGWIPPTKDPAIQRDGPESLLTKLLGGPMSEKPQLAQLASPLHWASPACAPLYIAHGTADPIVGVDQSQRLADQLKSLHVAVTLDLIEGAKHGGEGFQEPQRLLNQFAFLQKYLCPTPTPNTAAQQEPDSSRKPTP